MPKYVKFFANCDIANLYLLVTQIADSYAYYIKWELMVPCTTINANDFF